MKGHTILCWLYFLYFKMKLANRRIIGWFLNEVSIVIRADLGAHVSIDMQAVTFQFVGQLVMILVIRRYFCASRQVAAKPQSGQRIAKREKHISIFLVSDIG